MSSSSERNAFGKLSAWRHEAKRFPWPGVELERDSIELILAIKVGLQRWQFPDAKDANGALIPLLWSPCGHPWFGVNEETSLK